MEYNLITYDSNRISVNVLTYDLILIFESIFVPFKLIVSFFFSIKKQTGMTSRPNESVITNTSGLILDA